MFYKRVCTVLVVALLVLFLVPLCGCFSDYHYYDYESFEEAAKKEFYDLWHEEGEKYGRICGFDEGYSVGYEDGYNDAVYYYENGE